MKASTRISGFKRTCLAKLSRNDAEYFLDPGTVKDLCVLSPLFDMENKEIVLGFESDLLIVRYLQVLMDMNSFSEDIRDQKSYKLFGHVPMKCGDIISRNHTIDISYDLQPYWNQGHKDTLLIISAMPREIASKVDLILELFSTPITSYAIASKRSAMEVSFLSELKKILRVVKLHKSYDKAVRYILRIRNVS